MKPDDLLIAKLIESARANLKASEQLMPVFFVGKESGLEIIGAPFGDNDEKDATAEIIRRSAKDADFILFVSESWTIKQRVHG